MTDILPIGEYYLEENRKMEWIWGQLHLQTLLENNQLWVRHRYLDSDEKDTRLANTEIEDDWAKKRDESEWIRWPLGMQAQVKSLKLNAITPDLSYVIKSKYPIYLQPGQSVDIFVSIPSWLKVTASTADKELELHELSTVPLQKTWFGTPLDGELCYWRETHAYSGSFSKNTEPNYILCPVRIRNISDEILNFKQFNFRVEELTIFRYENQLWGDETRIDFKGQTMTSDISNTGRLPRYLGIKKPKLVSESRKQTRKSITRRTFNFLLNK